MCAARFSFLFALCLAALACGGPPTPSGATEPSAHPERIISFVPAVTEIVFALGEGHRLVGRTDFCKWPAEAAQVPSIGGLLNISWEQVRAREPDLAIHMWSNEDLYRPLQSLDVDTLAIHTETVDQVRDTIRAVAERLGVPERGEALVREMDVQIAAVAERLAGLEPRRTLLLIGREPGGWQSLFVAGPGSFVSELAEHAGAVNALGGETLGAYPTISREIIIATDPEVILDTVFEYTGSTPEQREAERALYRESLPTVTAVRDGRVILWDDPHLTVPGPGMAAQIEKLARAIHPEAFDD